MLRAEARAYRQARSLLRTFRELKKAQSQDVEVGHHLEGLKDCFTYSRAKDAMVPLLSVPGVRRVAEGTRREQ